MIALKGRLGLSYDFLLLTLPQADHLVEVAVSKSTVISFLSRVSRADCRTDVQVWQEVSVGT
jgi:hypothetical protein